MNLADHPTVKSFYQKGDYGDRISGIRKYAFSSTLFGRPALYLG